MFGQPELLLGFILAMSFYSSASLAANPLLAVSACHLSLSWLSSIQKLVVLCEMSTDAVKEENIVKEKHLQVLDVLKGLTVAQARFVLDIVIEDISSNAVIGSDQLTSSF